MFKLYHYICPLKNQLEVFLKYTITELKITYNYFQYRSSQQLQELHIFFHKIEAINYEQHILYTIKVLKSTSVLSQKLQKTKTASLSWIDDWL
jgi:hypothetical protein